MYFSNFYLHWHNFLCICFISSPLNGWQELFLNIAECHRREGKLCWLPNWRALFLRLFWDFRIFCFLWLFFSLRFSIYWAWILTLRDILRSSFNCCCVFFWNICLFSNCLFFCQICWFLNWCWCLRFFWSRLRRLLLKEWRCDIDHKRYFSLFQIFNFDVVHFKDERSIRSHYFTSIAKALWVPILVLVGIYGIRILWVYIDIRVGFKR